MPIHKVLDVSTAHITKRDSELLGDHEGPLVVLDHNYGYFVSVPFRPESVDEVESELRALGFSDALLGLLSHARQQECQWLNLDCDGDQEPELETFDW